MTYHFRSPMQDLLVSVQSQHWQDRVHTYCKQSLDQMQRHGWSLVGHIRLAIGQTKQSILVPSTSSGREEGECMDKPIYCVYLPYLNSKYVGVTNQLDKICQKLCFYNKNCEFWPLEPLLPFLKGAPNSSKTEIFKNYNFFCFTLSHWAYLPKIMFLSPKLRLLAL